MLVNALAFEYICILIAQKRGVVKNYFFVIVPFNLFPDLMPVLIVVDQHIEVNFQKFSCNSRP